ncbi:cell division protein ZapB [Aquisphaera insulae]|uniref:cell division protein ZapB n=1 Tax=Aquisphaera insulae TaxID=2712864 RepID=UPI0013EA3961|nr:cell division protein ZapB [Aquisphaera insulae]
MQKVAAYLLERRDDFESQEARRAVFVRCIDACREWLQSKGAADTESISGSFNPEDGGQGQFDWEDVDDGDRCLKILRLDEVDANGTRHITSVSATDTGSRISVHVSIEAGLNVSAIRPVPIDPRCPRVIRALLALGGDWFHGSSQLLALNHVKGDDDGEWLADQVIDPNRTIPLLVIAEDDNGLVLPGLDRTVAYDLVGLANVFVIDADAAWALTATLGKRWSCFSGGVRLYWPGASRGGDPFHHPLWTFGRLRAYGEDFDATRELFRRQLRQLVMQTSALSVMRPREIDAIQQAAIVRFLGSVRRPVVHDPEYEAIEQSYAKENDELRLKVESLAQRNQKLVQELEEVRDRLNNAELVARYHPQPTPVIAPVGPRDPEEDEGPQAGDIRFYKCVGHPEKYDKMELVKDCGHNSWQSAHKADKARKGIIRLEGKGDWKTLHHCGSCTGGGVWRVKW